jgi:dipeptidyl-peptidase-3
LEDEKMRDYNNNNNNISDFEIKILDNVKEFCILELPIKGFDQLTLKNKMLIYHLWHAAVAGDVITYDQNYIYGIALRDLFIGLMYHESQIPKELFQKISDYTKLLIINHGNYNGWTTKKFIPEFNSGELSKAIELSADNTVKLIRDLIPNEVLFDINHEPMLTQKTPENGDIITESHNNFYHGLTLKDLENFQDRYPNNSTVVKQNGDIIEEVWRSGSSEKNIPEGLYSKQLTRINYHLTQAVLYADDTQKEYIKLLIQYFEEGDNELFDQYNIAWVHTNPEVDMILGFIEEYRDTISKKGLFEGMIFYKDKNAQHIIDEIASKSQKLEDSAPWNPKYNKQWNKIPISNAIIQLIGTGGAGPLCWAGVNLPNSQKIREEHGSKSIYISNVTYASRNAHTEAVLKEFVQDEKERASVKKYAPIRSPVMVTLHEIVGHGSGKSSDKLKEDPREYLRENYSALEEARAELCALHHIWNPELRTIIPDDDCCKTAYLQYVLRDLVQMRTYTGSEIHEDHDRATRIIISYLMEQGACEYHKINGKTYPRIISYDKMREGVAELLAEIQRIKSEGDYDAGKALVEKHGVKFDTALRDEIVQRAKAINYPNSYAYVMPEPILIEQKGKVVDVKLKHYTGIIEQGKRWKELEVKNEENKDNS